MLLGRLAAIPSGGGIAAIGSGNQTDWVHEVPAAMSAQVTVVNPNEEKPIEEPRCKTDKVGVRILSELLRIDALPHPVHLPGRHTPTLRRLSVT